MEILYWNKDSAALNIVSRLEDMQSIMIEKDESLLYLEKLDEDADFFVIPSMHKSEAEKCSLTVHACGNFGNADFGGNPAELERTWPSALAVGLRSMAQAGLDDYEVCMEVTHHGPSGLGKPLVWIEIGSGEEQWMDERAGEVVAKAIRAIYDNKTEFENYIGFGGPHYAPSFTNLVLENEKIAIGHILPSYQAEHITKEIVEEMLEKSSAKKAVFDWKGLKRGARNKVLGILDELGVEYCKTSELRV
ncbi:MAG: D-aminoacyl-tRNA deacylase [archaeon]